MSDKNHALEQAQAQLESVLQLVKDFENAAQSGDTENAVEAIQQNALSVEVRTGWYIPGQKDNAADQYRIVLCTGGPHVEIRGALNSWGEAEDAALYYQDWGTLLERLATSRAEEGALITYARQFYFGEGA